jgi:hypothetical protein
MGKVFSNLFRISEQIHFLVQTPALFAYIFCLMWMGPAARPGERFLLG